MAGKRGYTTQRFNEELLHIKLEIQAHSLDMMIREIYENVGQVLSLARLNLTALGNRKTEEIKSTLTSSGELVGKAIKDLRLLSNPVTAKEITEKGLIVALQHEIQTINRIGHCTVQAEIAHPFPRFDTAEELVMFRIVQECLIIIASYAYNNNIIVTADHSGKEVTVSINSTITTGDELTGPDLSLLQKTLSAKARMINAVLSVNKINDVLEIQVRLSDPKTF
ncbi:MAG: hypothetical protein QM731_18230 [Chitinophagaceae bacterium]